MPSRSRVPPDATPPAAAMTAAQAAAITNALSDLSGATHRTAAAVLLGAQPSEIRARIDAIRAQLGTVRDMDGIR
jgi:hypothetical protein